MVVQVVLNGQTGHRINVFQKINANSLVNCKFLNRIYADYGSFSDDLHRFEYKDAPNCVWGGNWKP